MQRCGIDDNGANLIANALRKSHNTTLQQIRLSENNIGDDGARALAEALTNVRSPRLSLCVCGSALVHVLEANGGREIGNFCKRICTHEY